MLKNVKAHVTAAALVAMVGATGCFDFEAAQEQCERDGRCDGRPDGGPDGGPDPCEPTSPDDPPGDFIDSNCDGVDGLANVGFFVDPQGGDDRNPGTLERPVQTIRQALTLLRNDAGPGISALYLARGTYNEEQLNLDVPVSLYGAYGGVADFWRRKAEHITHLDGGTVGLTVSNLGEDSGVRMEWLTITSATGNDAGTASIALRVLGTQGLRLHHATIVAGPGSPGAPGADGQTGANGPDGGWGQDAGGATAGRSGSGGGANTHFCGTIPSWGGSGNLGGVRTAGSPGAAGQPPPDGGTGGDGGVLGSRLPQGANAFFCEAGHGQHGSPGVPGRLGPAGLGGADNIGELRDGLWSPTSSAQGQGGQTGTPGTAGGGGGSGGSCPQDTNDPSAPDVAAGAGSAGGGAGGCGGQGGGGGGPGGASIGVLLIDSTVNLGDVNLQVQGGGFGGRGGMGGYGGVGGLGGQGGFASTNATQSTWTSLQYFTYGGNGGSGGHGGDGGTGGPGGGGTGGPSVGVWCSNGGVEVTGTVTRSVKPGGSGGASSVNQGANGQAFDSQGCTPPFP
ncbi:hypothetical protein [Hyalangium rubrum]|uniref:DUF1565 domain-containing protein n=1 Tax=Hyalangium rubrum TaxID=3103134 RepID=A0ABU5GXA0_9BACT|nr:hypothetical protein [Hyalangium sp. s54d21]MDY7225814.1 hypothetical protein [Hyalangium sp. s54d21]